MRLCGVFDTGSFPHFRLRRSQPQKSADAKLASYSGNGEGREIFQPSVALLWFFGDPTPWQLGFETIYPSLLVHTIYGLSVALTSRAFVVRWTG